MSRSRFAIHRWRGGGQALLLLLGCLLTPRAAQGQYRDARLVPRGLLRISFEPHFTNYDRRFSLGTPGTFDGTAELLGTDLTQDTTGTNLFPSINPTEAAIRAITGDPDYRLDIGAFSTVLDADIRRFPFRFALGVSDRLTIEAALPIVTTRMQVAFNSDSTDANVGWNQAVSGLGDAASAAEAAALISQLGGAIADIENLITTGGFGCPSSPECTQAEMAVARATALRDNLIMMTGVQSANPDVQPFAPIDTSPAGTAITAEIAAVVSELESLGASPISSTLPLPSSRLGASDVNSLLADPDLGFAAAPLAFIRGTRFGDAEVTLRYGLITGESIRTVLRGTVRLPTGTVDDPDNFIDLPWGDSQTDLEVGLEAALEPGSSVGLSIAGSYTLQLPHQLIRRAGPPDSLLVPVSTRALFERDLGDIIRISAYPTIRLTSTFRVYGSVNYFRKQSDQYTLAGDTSSDPNPYALPERLERETKMESVSIGAGIAYHTGLTPTGGMPVEAGLHYRAAFSGSGGLTPKTNEMRVYLRLFYNLWRK